MCLGDSLQPQQVTCSAAEVNSEEDIVDQRITGTSLSSTGNNHHYIGSCQPPTSDNSSSTDNAVVTMSPSSLSTHPGQLHLVPVVYVNIDGVPTCYEVIQPVSSPSYFSNSPTRPSYTRANSSYDCNYFSFALNIFCSITKEVFLQMYKCMGVPIRNRTAFIFIFP